MKKRTIIGLVILMGISLLGIIAVQFYWFNNSVKVRNELFDRSVNEAMNKALHRLETGRDLKIIRNLDNGDSTKWNEQLLFPPPPPISESGEMEVIVKKDSANGQITVITSKSGKRKSESQTIRLRSFQHDYNRHPRKTS